MTQRRKLVAELQEQALGGLLPYPGDGREAAHFLSRDGRGKLAGRQRGEHAHGDAGADAGDREQHAEGGPIVLGGEAVERKDVFTDVGVDEERHDRALAGRPQAAEGPQRHEHVVADAAHVDDGGAVRVLEGDAPRQTTDHALSFGSLSSCFWSPPGGGTQAVSAASPSSSPK